MHTPVTSAAVYGGVGMGPQEHALRAGVDVIVATPGRLLDHFRHSYAALKGLEILVLDEADRMLDMGFLPDIKRVLRHLPGEAADAVLLGHPADADRRAQPRDAARPRDASTSTGGRRPRSGSRRRPTRWTRSSSRRCSWRSCAGAT